MDATAHDSFNPYHEWLGLEAGLADPDHYQLLGLDPANVDEASVTAAAARATTRVRSYRPGAKAAQWARLLDRIAEARKCLCDERLRVEYGRTLSEQRLRGTLASGPPTPSGLPLAGPQLPNSQFPPGHAPAQARPPIEPHQGAQPQEIQPQEPQITGPYGFAPNSAQAPSSAVPSLASYAPGQYAPAQYAPAQYGPAQYAPAQYAPGQVAPGQYAPGQYAPGQYAPAQYAPGQVAPGQYAPGQVAPGQYAPGQVAPGQYAPGQYAPGQYAPAQYATSHVMPGQYVPGQYAPAQASGQYAPGQSDSSAYVPVPAVPAVSSMTADPMAPFDADAPDLPVAPSGMFQPTTSGIPMGTAQVAGGVPMGTAQVAGGVPMGTAQVAGGVPMGTAVAPLVPEATETLAGPALSGRVPSKVSGRHARRGSNPLAFLAIGAALVGTLGIVLFMALGNRPSATDVAQRTPRPESRLAGSSTSAGSFRPAVPLRVERSTAGSSGSRSSGPGAGMEPDSQPGTVSQPPLSPNGARLPEPTMSEPMQPEPTQPEPMQPEPTQPEPTQPAPTVPEPGSSVPGPAPTPEMTTPLVKPTVAAGEVTRAELVALGDALRTARTALGEQNFDVAAEELAKAEALAKLPAHVAKLTRLKSLSRYVEGFWDAVAQAVAGLEGTDEFMVGSTVVVVVETSPESIIIKANGVRREYAIRQLPPGLAVAIADQWFDPGKPENRVFKGAYIAVMRNADAEDLAKGRGWWQQAQAAGIDLGDLPAVYEDTYDLVKDLPAEAKPGDP